MTARGEQSKSAKLTEGDVVRLRAMHAAGSISYAEIARQYGVTAETVARICRRESWRHVPDQLAPPPIPSPPEGDASR